MIPGIGLRPSPVPGTGGFVTTTEPDRVTSMIIDYLTTGLSGFDPEEFPEAQDFTVEFTPSEFGLRLTYRVESPEIVMRWGWLKSTDAEMYAWTVDDVPRGTLRHPYHESDQGWNAMIWEMDDHVYIAEGDGGWDEERDSNTYVMWFKVSRDLHDRAWTAALDRLRAG